MMLTLQKFLTFFCLLFVLAGSSFGKSITSITPKKKPFTVIYESNNRKSEEVGKLQYGKKIDAIERKGMYWKVNFNKKEAYISVRKVKIVKSDNSGVLNLITEEIQKSQNKDDSSMVRARSAVMGVRGLDEGRDIEFVGNVRPNLRLVYNMEGLVVSKSDIISLQSLVENEITLLEKK